MSRMKKNLNLEPIYKSLKDLIFSLVLLIIFFIIFFVISSKTDLSAHKDDNLIFYYLIPFSFVAVLLHISIYRLAKALNKNATAWVFANIAFPIVLSFSIFYFLIVASYQIIKLKIRGHGEPGH